MSTNFLKVLTLSIVINSCAHKGSNIDRSLVLRYPNAESEALIRYDYKEGELTTLCEGASNNLKKQIEAWRNENKSNGTESKGLLSFENIIANFGDELAPLAFMGSVSTDAKIREESSKCEAASSVVTNEIFTNRANYEILKSSKPSNPEEERLLKETLFTFEMNGMKLNDDELKKYKTLKDRLSQLAVDFGQNLNNDVSSILLSEQELKGVKSDFLARLKKDAKGSYIVTTKSPDYIHVMENAIHSETRKKMLFAYNNRQSTTNTPILQEATKIRAEIGQLMGYPTYADYSLREKMAGNSKTVFDFLNGLKDKLSAKNKSDLKALEIFKSKTLKDISPLMAWDIPYVSNQLKIKKYDVDEDAIRQYFPAKHVVDQILDIYSQLLGVSFRRIENALVWAPQVDLYEVTDKTTKKVVAYFYADLIPREGKYGHAAAFPLKSGRVLESDGTYQKPIASIVANFTPASPGKPVLLSHDEVETFFHEFGHIMHQVLTKAKYASLSGSNVKGDYVEAPSQMLENWVWQKEILLKMSKNYLDPKKKMPLDLISKLQKIRNFNSGIQYTRQLVFGLFDMNIHTNPKLDVTEEFGKVYFELTSLKALEGSHFPATFGHMMGGYSAGYYGYLWSKVFAEDMFSIFQKKGILSPAVGMKYRQQILEPGNMKDPLELIKGFLGREPNNKAFFKSLGI